MIRRRSTLTLLPALALLVACAATQRPPADGEFAERRVLSSSGVEAITFETSPSPIPLNEPFELLLGVFDADSGEPCSDAEVFVRAWMPDHGHGMFRQPEVVPTGPGTFRVKGLLFHMGGMWEFSVDVIRAGLASSATLEVHL